MAGFTRYRLSADRAPTEAISACYADGFSQWRCQVIACIGCDRRDGVMGMSQPGETKP